MRFNKVYIEITNICNLECSFCPTKNSKPAIMDLILFEKINKEVSSYTKELAYHIVGDPLTLKNLDKYIKISHKYNLKVNITTTGNNLKSSMFEILTHGAIKQVNFSLNSYSAIANKKSLDEYLKPIFEFCDYCIEYKKEIFINLRLWNIDQGSSAKLFNKEIYSRINRYFNINIDIQKVYQKGDNIRIGRKVLINFDEYFEWPQLSNSYVGDSGYCYGLKSHFAITVDGVVVPCCLDQNAIMSLGNMQDDTITNLLKSQRSLSIIAGFKNHKIVEKLCQHCSFRVRFD